MTDEEKNKLAAFLLAEYGLQISPTNELIPIYHALSKSADKLEQSTSRFIAQTEKMNTESKTNQFHFNYLGSAKDWWMGKVRMATVVSSFLAAAMLGVYYLYDRNKSESAVVNLSKMVQIEQKENFFLITPEKQNRNMRFEKIRLGQDTAIRINFNKE